MSTAVAVRAVAEEWNPGGVRSIKVPTGELLDSILKQRLTAGHPLYQWAHDNGLLVDGKPTTKTVGDHPNPFGLVLGAHPNRRRELRMWYGRAHRDLHPGNLLFGPESEQFWLIDFARYDSKWPLTYDPAYLLLTICAHLLPSLGTSGRTAAINLLLDDLREPHAMLPQPFRELIQAIQASAASPARTAAMGEEWHAAMLLTFVGCGLIMCGRSIIAEDAKEWFLALAAEAAQRYVELDDGAPEMVAPAVPTRPRVIAEDRASLRVPSVTAISRTDLLAAATARRDKRTPDQQHRQILALLGDGGIGKTVLLGQYLDQLDDHSHAVVLVACGSISSGAELTSAAEADMVFGLAADLRHGRDGLLALLAAQRVAYGAVTLLVDTIDLLIDQMSAPSIGSLLAEAVKVADVVITCRTFEFSNHLHDGPRLVGRITTYDLPKLDEQEIVRWAEWYLSTGERTADHSMFIESLSGSISTSKALQQVCSLPVRLALACLTFADRGVMPEDLSVTGLYQEYWNVRVRAHGSDKERAALAVARHVVTPSGRFTMRAPKALVPKSLRTGLDALISEGVLQEHASDWEFFHQTFAEFAHARWALTHGVESDEVSQLIERTMSGLANSWAVLLSMLLQVDEFADYQVVARLIPMTSADAVQIQTLGALQRAEPEALDSVLSSLADHLELLPVTLDTLRDAPPQHVPGQSPARYRRCPTHPVWPPRQSTHSPGCCHAKPLALTSCGPH
ncbi:MAG TPA: hypothetical protein VGG05_03430 [Pseudonocardiaceae bacterium]